MPAQAIFLGLLALVMAFLPSSPFQMAIQSVGSIPYLSYLNWFFPVTECIAVLEVWLSAIVIYYVYSAIMRWIKIIG